jgi:hypothetical protein
MHIFSNIQLLLIGIYHLASSTTALPSSRSSSKPNAIPGNYNCHGSGFCSPLVNSDFHSDLCLNQSANYKPNEMYTGYTSFAANGCAAIFRCSDSIGYQAGVNGTDVLKAYE